MANLEVNETQPIRILVVDDHPVVCDGLTAMIEQERDMVVVGEADDGLCASERVAELKPQVVVMDLMLPRLGGVDATKLIKADFPDVKVLVLTGMEEPALLQRALRAGASGIMFKRRAADELVRAIRCVAEGGQFLEEGVIARSNGRESGKGALSEREREVLQLLAGGYTARDIAVRLHISVRTLETYRARAMEKLALKNRADIVRYAAAQGWLRSD
jgi:DNA-binding NarL/FixJ family response regulator